MDHKTTFNLLHETFGVEMTKLNQNLTTALFDELLTLIHLQELCLVTKWNCRYSKFGYQGTKIQIQQINVEV